MGYSVYPNPKIKIVDLSDDTQVNAGGSNNSQSLQPNSGKIYEIIEIYYDAADPSGSTSGTHQLEIQYYDGTNSMTVARIRGNTGSGIGIYTSDFSGDSQELPADAREQALLRRGRQLLASNSAYLIFKYTNNTDANQTGTRTCYVVVKETNGE